MMRANLPEAAAARESARELGGSSIAALALLGYEVTFDGVAGGVRCRVYRTSGRGKRCRRVATWISPRAEDAALQCHIEILIDEATVSPRPPPNR